MWWYTSITPAQHLEVEKQNQTEGLERILQEMGSMRPKLVSLEEIKTKINQTNRKKNQRRGLAKGTCEVGEGEGGYVESSGEKSSKKLVWPLMYAVLPVTESSVVSKLSMVAHVCNPTSVGKRIMSSRPGWAIYSSETLCQKERKEGRIRRGSDEE